MDKKEEDRFNAEAKIQDLVASDPEMNIVPDRGLHRDTSVQWRFGSKPNYAKTDLAYLEGKTQKHKAGSLEKLVEDLVKRWEMEGEHKLDINQWDSVDLAKYTVRVNGGPIVPGTRAAKLGNYNWLMAACPKDLYDAESHTFETASHTFRTAFEGGFPWEVLKVFSGPPKVAFSWRHWATFDGTYKGNQGKGQTIVMEGCCVAEVTVDLKIQTLEVFFQPDDFLKQLVA